MPPVYLSVGSNLGDREANIRQALRGLRSLLREVHASSLYETEPMYLRDQPLFLNAVLRGAAELDPEALLSALKQIEADCGRRHTVAKGPRVLDLDILLYGQARFSSPALIVPHPAMRERAFVLVPLMELEPGIREPGTGVPYQTYLDRLDPRGVRFHSTLHVQGRYVGRSSEADLPAG